MAKTKYGEHLVKADITAKEGEDPVFRFSAAPYGIDASWVFFPVTKTDPFAEDLPTHKHGFHQFINWFGADPRNIEEFSAEGFICLGEEQEKHIINTPTIQNLPPGTPHCPGGWLRVDKPVYHLDIFFAPEWAKTDVKVVETGVKGPIEGTKYSKHLIKAPIQKDRKGQPSKTLYFSAAEYGVKATWILVPVIEPFEMEVDPHKHDFHQFFCYLGSNPRDQREFDAEIEVYLGKEGEKHVITSPTVLHVPPGLIHCPMIYKRVGKPVMHLDVFFAPDYERIPASR